MLDPNDGGWKSRKLWFSVFTSVLIVLAAMWGVKHAGFEIMYPELVMGLIGVASLFFGANSFSKWNVARNAKNLVAAAADDKVKPGE